ncbi:MAG: TIGR01841 family phasin [Pseudomonadota bacterium]
MNNQQFPFVFDAEKMQEMFRIPEMDKMFEQMRMPALDMEAVMAAQQKNITAMVEANKAAMSGYQEIYKRQVALVEESLAQAKDQLGDLQGQSLSADQAQKNMESLKTSFDKLSKDLRELADMAQQTNTEAFNIVRSRFEEAIDEFKKAGDKLKG